MGSRICGVFLHCSDSNTNEIYGMFLVLQSSKNKTFTFDASEALLISTYLRICEAV